MEKTKRKAFVYIIYIISLCNCLSLKADFLKTYDDLKQSNNFSESHFISYADAFTQKGGGLFSWLPNDTRAEAWGLIIKSNLKGAAGSWVRQNVTSLNPDWFGATRTKTAKPDMQLSFRALGYTEQQIKARYSIYIPDISLNDYPDWAAIQMMCKLQEQGWLAIELPSGDYYINRKIILPEPDKPNTVVQYSIEGNGSWFYSVNNNGFPFFSTMPKNQSESQNVFCARRFTIKNLSIIGRREVAGTVGIAIGGTFQSLIENIHLIGLDTGIVLRHAMSTTVLRCNAVGCRTISYFMGSGRNTWEGGNSTNSGCNQSKIISCRQFTSDGQFAGVYISESSECRVEDFVLDGSGKRHTSYGIYIDTRNASTVKDGYVKGIHGEAAVDSALVKFRGNTASFQVSDVFVQYSCTLVELEGSSQVQCSQFSYFPGDCTFASKGGGIWKFDNVFNRAKSINWRTDGEYSIPDEKRVRNDKKL